MVEGLTLYMRGILGEKLYLFFSIPDDREGYNVYHKGRQMIEGYGVNDQALGKFLQLPGIGKKLFTD